jgi:ribonuclease BN (tRNA processing enzyme)
MKVHFVGVGEAFDENLPNTSILVYIPKDPQKSRYSPVNVLMDCGFTVPSQLWKMGADADFIDILTISHFHADHTFGIPALLVRMAEGKRSKALYITGMPGTEEFLGKLMDIAYPGLMKKIPFEIIFNLAQNKTCILGINFEFAETGHFQKNFAIAISDGRKSLAFSGDGNPTAESILLFKNKDLLIHEAYFLDQESKGHSSVAEVLSLVPELQVKIIALVHLNRELRQGRMADLEKIILEENGRQAPTRILLPLPGAVVNL